MSPARPSDRRAVTVCQCMSKKAQVTATCMTSTGRTMISSDRPHSEVGSRRFRNRVHRLVASSLIAASVRGQHIADAAHGLEIARVLGIRLQLAAQACDLHVHGAAGDVGGVG